MFRLLLTTDPGLEDVAIDELAELDSEATATPAPYGHPGHIRAETVALDSALGLRTIHHVTEIRQEAEAATLDDVRAIVGDTSIDELRDAASFRVTSTRSGVHDFEHMDIQGAAGAVLQRRYGTRVDLEGFEINVRVDLHDQRLVAGIQHTRTSLGNRLLRGKALRSSLRPTIAAAMLRLGGAHRGSGRLIDPMCGAGTIPVEAIQTNPALEVSASDWDEETVEAARGTLDNHGLDLPLRVLDARALGECSPGAFDHIVTDPPYGMRQARHAHLTSLYRNLLGSFQKALADEGRITVIVLKHRVFESAMERTGLRWLHRRTVQAGSIRPRIYVLGT